MDEGSQGGRAVRKEEESRWKVELGRRWRPGRGCGPGKRWSEGGEEVQVESGRGSRPGRGWIQGGVRKREQSGRRRAQVGGGVRKEEESS